MISILKLVIKTKNHWGLKSLLIGSMYELFFLITNPGFKYFFAVEPQDLDISKEDSELCGPYGPAPYYILNISLKHIKKVMDKFQDSIFIDIGCGPGRALYCASTFGFNRLIGIEQSKNLTDLCNKNLNKYLPSQVSAKIINQNVININFINLINEFNQSKKIQSVVFFLYAPFIDDILKILLDKFDELNFLDCYIIYFGPQNESMITEKKFSLAYGHSVNPDTPIKIYSRKKSQL